MAHDHDPDRRPTDPNAPKPPADDQSGEWQKAHPLSDDDIGPLPVEEGSLADVEYGQLSETTELGSDSMVPPAEVEPLLSAEPVGPGSNTDPDEIFPAAESASDPLLEESQEIPYAELPPTLSGSGSDLFASPGADSSSGSKPTLSGSSSDLFATDVPMADPASGSNLFGTASSSDAIPVPESKSGSSIEVGKPDSNAPVAPGSGWLESQQGEAPTAGEAVSKPAGSKSDFELILPAEPVESSDIFSSSVPMAKSVDQSDVIAATAFGEVEPAAPAESSSSDRGSDMALTFDQPPGGSTIADAAAAGDLPLAEEVSDSIFGSTEELPAFESGVSTKTPPLSKDDLHSDEDISPYDSAFGGMPPLSPDASSILSDAGEDSLDDSSGIRLESPRGEGTVTNEPGAENLQPTEADFELPEEPPVRPASPATVPSFELTPHGADDSIEATLAQASLADNESSIFTGPNRPGSTGDSSSVPIEALDSNADAVEFSDHPNPDAADSGTLHSPGTPSDQINWADRPGGAGPAEGPPSSHILHGGALPPVESPSSSDVASIEDILEAAEDDDRGASPPARSGHDTELSTSMRDPSVEIDWMAQSSEEVALPPEVAVPGAARAPAPAPAAKSRPTAPLDRSRAEEDYDDNEATLPQPVVDEKRRPVRAKSGRGLVAGALVGLVLGSGATAGLFLSGIIPGKEPTKQSGANAGGSNQGGSQAGGGVNTAAGAADAGAASLASDPFKVVQALEKAGAETPESKAALGQARLYARLRELAASNASAAPGDAALQQARTELEAAANDSATPQDTAVRAMLHLGLTHELAGDPAGARTVYSDGLKKFPNAAPVFQAALERLAATDPNASATSLRLTPAEAEQLAAAVTILFALDAEPVAQPATKEPAEPGTAFWKAINSAAAGKYDDALKQIAEAKKLHVARARALAGQGLNPLTDPLEQIFPRCCDDLTAYWNLRKSLYEHPGVGAMVKKEGVAKALDQLAAAEKRAIDLANTAASLKKENDTMAADLKKARDAVTVAEKDLKAKQLLADKLEKENKGLEDLKKEFDIQAAKYRKNIDTLTLQIEKSDLDKRNLGQTIDSVAKELQSGKLLGPKHTSDELVAATRSAVSRATGPDLSKLISSELSAVAGTGLTTGQLLSLANRVNKSETAAAALAADLKKEKADHDVEVKKLNDTYKADLKKLNDTHAADLKKLTDAQALAIKKAGDANSKEIDKLKESHKAEMKKLADKYAADVNRLIEDQKLAMKKVEDANAEKVKALEAAIAVEKSAAAGAEKRFRADLASAISPADALDIWLPLITELRRPSDADGALDAANKVLKTAAPGSDDAGKALTLAGLAQLLKGNTAAAKDLLAEATRTPAYKLAKVAEEKEKKAGWAHAADVGLTTVADPAAPARLPAPSDARERDVFAAARYLDAGITAYKAGRHADAEKNLAEAAWHDPTDAVAWYFLGASRWEADKREAAKDDFRQGAQREAARVVPVRVINDAISAIQGPARDALNAARP